MSSISQISPRRHATSSGRGRSAGAFWMIGSAALAAAILGLALSPLAGPIASTLAGARPHAPDLAVWRGLSVPIRIHLVTALAALLLGGALMVVRKGRMFHRIAGWTWVALVSATAGATLFITSLNPGAWSVLHLFTGWVLLGLPLAVIAAKRKSIAKHRGHMMGLFYGGFAVNLLFALMPGRTLWMMVLG
ncbi:MAG: hypothetical protein U1C74_11015 [Phenylobacterium sp.]|nr:hypothetical protein [Phenylobacterium sp.]